MRKIFVPFFLGKSPRYAAATLPPLHCHRKWWQRELNARNSKWTELYFCFSCFNSLYFGLMIRKSRQTILLVLVLTEKKKRTENQTAQRIDLYMKMIAFTLHVNQNHSKIQRFLSYSCYKPWPYIQFNGDLSQI